MTMTRLLVMADGRSVHTSRWCSYFIDAGWEVALFSLEPPSDAAPVRCYSARKPTSMDTVNYWLAKRAFRAAAADFGPDVISAHYAASYGWLASYWGSCPVVVTTWGSDLLILPRKSIIHRRRVARALSRAAYCTVDGKNLFDAVAAYISPDKIVRAVMGVDRDYFAAAEKTDYSHDGPIRIIAPRGLPPVYDPGTIVAAAALLEGKLGFRIDLSGSGPQAEAIMKEVSRRSLSDIIAMRPFVTDLRAHRESLKGYDLHLSASLSDSTSVSLLEAMATGLFPVVTRIDGNREWIEDGRNGLLFAPRSPESLADAILRAAAMRRQWSEIAAYNRRRVADTAIWEDNMERVKRLFVDLAG